MNDKKTLTSLKDHYLDSTEIDILQNDEKSVTIVYHTPALVLENNNVRERQKHHIELSLPFGFPVFPPICKPLTPLFHPDIDPDAICLGDFWTPEKNCIELVEYIGKMLRVEFYSTEMAFNEDAVNWYLEHQELFPLTSKIASQPQTPPPSSVMTKETTTEEAPARKKKFPLVIASVASFFLTALLISFFLYNKSQQVTEVRELYTECTNAVDQMNFAQAKQLCEEVSKKSSATFLGLPKSLTELKRKSQKVLNSETVTQGIKGNIHFEGKWMSKDEYQQLHDQKALQQTIKAIKNEKWSLANEQIQRISVETPQSKHLKQEIAFYQQVENFLNQKDRCPAVDNYLKNRAYTLSQQGAVHPKIIHQFEQRLAECSFLSLRQKGDKLYHSAEWKKALPLYQNALAQIEEDITSPKKIAIQAKINKVQLYETINTANQAFRIGDWQRAIDEYKKAVQFLENEEGLNNTQKKLEKIIIQATIIQTETGVQQSLKNGNFHQAIILYKNLLQTIKKSDFSTAKEFNKILKNTQKKLRQTEKNYLINQLQKELESKQLSLFETYVPKRKEQLKSPKTSFQQQKGSLYIYKMSMIDMSQSRPLTLIIYRAYNKNTGKWESFDADDLD